MTKKKSTNIRWLEYMHIKKLYYYTLGENINPKPNTPPPPQLFDTHKSQK